MIDDNSKIMTGGPANHILPEMKSNKMLEQMKQRSFYSSSAKISLTNSRFATHIKSPIAFDKQLDRSPITSGLNVNDNRFTQFNSMSTVLSKYKKTATPDFSKTSTKDSIDCFLGPNAKNPVNAVN